MATKQFSTDELEKLARAGIRPGSIPGTLGPGILGGGLGGIGGGLGPGLPGELLQLGQLAQIQQMLQGPDTSPLAKTFGLGKAPADATALGFAPSGPNINFLGGSPFEVPSASTRLLENPAALNNLLAVFSRQAQQRRQQQGREDNPFLEAFKRATAGIGRQPGPTAMGSGAIPLPAPPTQVFGPGVPIPPPGDPRR